MSDDITCIGDLLEGIKAALAQVTTLSSRPSDNDGVERTLADANAIMLQLNRAVAYPERKQDEDKAAFQELKKRFKKLVNVGKEEENDLKQRKEQLKKRVNKDVNNGTREEERVEEGAEERDTMRTVYNKTSTQKDYGPCPDYMVLGRDRGNGDWLE